MSTKHTPGPWNAIEPNPEDRCLIETRKDGKLVAFIEGDDGSPHTDAANAARIVACVNACEGIADPSVVPEIIAALRGCGPSTRLSWNFIEEIVARARGEES